MRFQHFASVLSGMTAAITLDNRPAAPAQFVIRVSGSPGTGFRGTLNVTGVNGETTEQLLQGQAPNEFTVTGLGVELSLRQQGDSGTLHVEIQKDGQVVSTSVLSGEGSSVSAAIA